MQWKKTSCVERTWQVVDEMRHWGSQEGTRQIGWCKDLRRKRWEQSWLMFPTFAFPKQVWSCLTCLCSVWELGIYYCSNPLAGNPTAQVSLLVGCGKPSTHTSKHCIPFVLACLWIDGFQSKPISFKCQIWSSFWPFCMFPVVWSFVGHGERETRKTWWETLLEWLLVRDCASDYGLPWMDWTKLLHVSGFKTKNVFSYRCAS